MKFQSILCIFLFFSIFNHSGLVYPETELKFIDKKKNTESDEKQEKFQKWALLPVIAGSTESGLMFGALAVRFLKSNAPSDRTATIDFITVGTMKGQYIAIINPNLYLADQKYHLNATLNGAFWPGYFYGIGNDTPEDNPLEYTSTSFKTECILERRIGRFGYVGVTYTFQHEALDIDNGIAPEYIDISGLEGGNQSGLGATVSIDTRDNVNDARTGTYIQLISKWFRETFGSDYDYHLSALYAYHYFKVTPHTGLALGGQLRRTRGDIPFRELSSPDGVKVLRGIESGRYRDQDMAALQTEYRFPIKGKWGGTVFIETAQVAHELSDLKNNGWKYSMGAGIRYALNPSERFNMRLDLSWVDNGFGFSLNIREAF